MGTLTILMVKGLLQGIHLYQILLKYPMDPVGSRGPRTKYHYFETLINVFSLYTHLHTCKLGVGKQAHQTPEFKMYGVFTKAIEEGMGLLSLNPYCIPGHHCITSTCHSSLEMRQHTALLQKEKYEVNCGGFLYIF